MPRTANIPRALLVEAVEAGIANAPEIPNHQRAALRRVALYAVEIAWGTFIAEGGVRCPLVVSGVTDQEGYSTSEEVPQQAVKDFYYAYDDVVFNRLRVAVGVTSLTVED